MQSHNTIMPEAVVRDKRLAGTLEGIGRIKNVPVEIINKDYKQTNQSEGDRLCAVAVYGRFYTRSLLFHQFWH